MGLKPAAVPPREPARRARMPRGRHPGCAGLRFGTCKTPVP
ncbi:hypothetical protein OH687_17465 [Burkholderia anthina]|nr:hypothetical protein OH687_17465 [Burkholderia anthina]